jgi:glycosyltransferase involved in cell wall biosynthesis
VVGFVQFPTTGSRVKRNERPVRTSMTSVRPDSRHLAVVPAFNEAATVGDVVRRIHRDAPEWEVVVVDDGSTDRTAEVAEESGARVLRLPFNLGIGGAVQAGFVFAREQGYDYMAQVDGDGQHDPRELDKLIAYIQAHPEIDMVCGSRFLRDSEHHYLAPISRRTGIHIFAFLLSRFVRQPITDPTSGFRLYNRDAIRLFATDYPHDYPEVEAVLMLHHHRLRMEEIPVRMFARGGGVSSISSGKSAYYMVKVLLALFVGLFRRRPIPEPGAGATVAAETGI